MVNFRKKVNKKGKRWIKGQSSESNPECRSHRNRSTASFYSEGVKDKTPLTIEYLHSFDSLSISQKSVSTVGSFKSQAGSVISGDSFRTVDSFASQIMQTPFSNVFKKLNLHSKHHQEMLAILSAIAEVIKSNGGKENITDYFAALMTTLDGFQSNEEGNVDSIRAIFALLCSGTKYVPKPVLQLKFAAISKVYSFYLGKYAETDNVTVKYLIPCISGLLRSQTFERWSDFSTVSLYDSILAFVIHSNPKVRKSAQHAVGAILNTRDFLGKDEGHPACCHTGKHCLSLLESSASTGAQTTCLHLFTVLKDILHLFPKSQLKGCCEAIFKLFVLRNILITSCGLEALHSMFKLRPKPSHCPPSLNAQIINALYDHQPSASDTQPMCAWLTVMQEAFLNLAPNDLPLCAAHLPKLFHTCSMAFLSHRPNVIKLATATMENILKICLPPMTTRENLPHFEPQVGKIFNILTNGMKYQYQASWKETLRLLAAMYQFNGKNLKSLLLPYLTELAEFRDSEIQDHCEDVENVVEAAIRCFGPEEVIKVVKFQYVKEDGSLELKRSWLLPLLRENVKNSTLRCFEQHFIPAAMILKNQYSILKESNRDVEAISCAMLQSQIWTLLINFCDHPSDIAETFPRLASVLGDILSRNPNLQQTVMSALRKLILSCRDLEVDEQTMRKYAKNYLPILFNLYMTPLSTGEAVRAATLDTIKAYLTVTDVALRWELFHKAWEKLQTPPNDGGKPSKKDKDGKFHRESMLDLLRLLLPYQSCEEIARFYEGCIIKLGNCQHFKEEKKYYRLLEEMCASHSEGCNEFLQKNAKNVRNLLAASLSKASLPSKGPRIRCLKHLLDYDDGGKEVIFENLSEAVLCCKDKNERCRASAYELIVKLLDKAENVGEFMEKLCEGFEGSVMGIAATILAAAYLMHERREQLVDHSNSLLGKICLLATSSTREIVGPALGYMKTVVLDAEKDDLAAVPTIIETLSKLSEDCKRCYRQKLRDLYARLLRKYGFEFVVNFVSPEDSLTLTRLRLLKKEADRKKRIKKAAGIGRGGEDEDDDEFAKKKKKALRGIDEILDEFAASSNEDSPDEEEEESKKRKNPLPRVYLKEEEEEIIDFTSPTAAKNITAGNPGLKKRKKMKVGGKNGGFKVASDGRLVIPDEGDDEDDASDKDVNMEKGGKGVKRKLEREGSPEVQIKYKAGGSGIHRPANKKKRSSMDKYSGQIYKGQKGAGGDMRKRGMPEPFAYLPLTRDVLNKRKRKKSDGKLRNIVKGAKKGASKGAKNKFKKNKNNKK